MNPLKCNEGVIVVAPRLFGSVAYYAVLASADSCMDFGIRYNKRDKAVHRYAVADVRGRLELTVPIVHPAGSTTGAGLTWADVGVSSHGRWWEVHKIALESAYGRTPFYEHYGPRIEDVLQVREESVADLCRRADAVVRDILGMETPVAGKTEPTQRITIEPHLAEELPYWQVRGDSLGFIGNLSILDLIFNLGPEAPLHLLKVQKALGLR